MGTFGAGPFDSDAALDLLDELADRSKGDRPAALARMFTSVTGNPQLLWREYFPDQVVAAAALVAASLPGGESITAPLRDLVDNELVPDGRLPTPAPELAQPALDTLFFVASPERSRPRRVIPGVACKISGRRRSGCG